MPDRCAAVFYVLVLPLRPLSDLGEDAAVLGAYAVHGQRALGVPDEACVTDVLNAFHDQFGIEDLDALDIVVLNADGVTVGEPETATPGHLLSEGGRLTPEWLADDGVAWLADFRLERAPAAEVSPAARSRPPRPRT
jgi:hypothetical protein